jgi:thermitase
MPRALSGRWRRVIAGTLALTLSCFAPVTSGTAANEADTDDHISDELLVGFHDDVTAHQAEAVYHAEGAAKLEKLWRVNVHRIQLNPAFLSSMEQRLRERPEVKFVERNRRILIALVPTDPVYSQQWHLPRISAPQAWDVTTGSPAVVIGVLDSGIEPSHPDLAANLVAGWNFYDNNADTRDVNGHGTLVAGAAAAIGNNGLGVAGVAMQSRIMPLRVSDPAGYAYYSTVANALTWAADNGAKVMNISFGGVAASSSIRSAAQYARLRGAVVVASAGNCSCVDGTAENPQIISVSSTGGADALSGFSSRGQFVDLAAPGEGIRSTDRSGGYTSASGTSFSSPITAGVVALMMAINPSLTPVQLEQLLKANADDLGPSGWDSSYGFGRLNAYRAVAAAAAGSGPDTTAPTVSIIAPTAGTVAGAVAVNVNASDGVGVTRVELWVDGALAATDATAPWSFSWNSASRANGLHSLVARAYDAAGHVGTSAAVRVRVNNATARNTPAPGSVSNRSGRW